MLDVKDRTSISTPLVVVNFYSKCFMKTGVLFRSRSFPIRESQLPPLVEEPAFDGRHVRHNGESLSLATVAER